MDDPAGAKVIGLAVLGFAVAAALTQAALAVRARMSSERRPPPSPRPGEGWGEGGVPSPDEARALDIRKPAARDLRGGESNRPSPVGDGPAQHPPAGEARALHGAAALLATSVLADSAIEHYRGSFENPGMYTPLVTSALTLLSGTEGAAVGSGRLRLVRKGAYATAVAVGAIGTGFHLYNIDRRPGGVSWLNLFYAAPFGAPAALSLAGLIGLAAERLDGTPAGEAPRLLGLPAGRALSALTGAGLAGTVGEAGLYHFRGAFQNPFMWLPVTVPPVASALMVKAALGSPPEGGHRLTRAWLAFTACLGIGGMGFHAYGVSRAMGGWRNWSQNVINGPPLPAPPSFSALSIAALAALSLLERGRG